MTVKFYNLKINPQNRFYNKVAYENNINDTNVIETIDLNKEIIPNQVFYLKRDNKSDLVKLMGCAYITYEINGTKFGGFITNIQLLAPKGKTIAVYHSVDWWYFTLLNELSFDMHGNCLRAHVNDIDKETKKYTMLNTTSTKETNISNFKTVDIVNKIDEIGYANVSETYGSKILSGYSFLYIFVNKIPSGWGFVGDNYIGKQHIHGKSQISQGYLFTYLLNCNDGSIYPLYTEEQADVQEVQNIIDITPSDPHIMFISDGFICSTFDYKIEFTEKNYGLVSFRDGFENYNGFKITTLKSTSNNRNIPHYYSFCWYGVEVPHWRIMNTIDYNNLYLYSKSRTDYSFSKENNYNDYLLSIPKFYSSTYQNSFLNNNEIDYSKIYSNNNYGVLGIVETTIDFKYNVSYFLESEYNFEYITINPNTFTSDTALDYKTELNYRLASINAKQVKLSGQQASLGGVKKIVSGAMNVATGLVEGLTGDVGGGFNQAVGGAVDIGSGILQMQQGDLLNKQSKVMQDIANYQRQDGEIKQDTPTGYYTQKLSTNGTYIRILSTEITKSEDILIDLHRFGYNTFLQLDEIYKNHQREHFNYFQASDIEITGLPLFIASDLQNMFLSGVHLWTRDIEEFENGTNYQLGLWD